MVIFEGKKMLSKANLHSEIGSKLNFPDYYGGNLDALWDCLTGWVELPIEIVWQDFGLVKNSLGDYASSTLKLLQKADGVTVIVKDALES